MFVCWFLQLPFYVAAILDIALTPNYPAAFGSGTMFHLSVASSHLKILLVCERFCYLKK